MCLRMSVCLGGSVTGRGCVYHVTYPVMHLMLPGDMVNKWVVRFPLECVVVFGLLLPLKPILLVTG